MNPDKRQKIIRILRKDLHWNFYEMITLYIGVGTFILWLIFLSLEGKYQLFTPADVNTTRYMLSSAFQGLSALFALTISIAFVVTQSILSNYSSRLVSRIFRKKWVIAGFILFISSLLFNFLLLNYFESLKTGALQCLLCLDYAISISSIIYLVPFTYRFAGSLHPESVARDLVDAFNDNFFQSITGNYQYDRDFASKNPLPLFQGVLIQSLKNSDDDTVRRSLGTLLFHKILTRIDRTNYSAIYEFFAPFFKRVIALAAEHGEEEVLKEIALFCEKVESRVDSIILTGESSYFGESFISLINEIVTISIKYDLSDSLQTALFGNLARLGDVVFPRIPPDDEVSDFRDIAYVRSGDERLQNNHQNYENSNKLRYVENTFIGEILGLASYSITQKKPGFAKELVRAVFYKLYDVDKLNGQVHEKARARFVQKLYFGLDDVLRVAIANDTNIFHDLITEVQTSMNINVLWQGDGSLVAGIVRIACDSLRYIFDQEKFEGSSAFTLNMLGTMGRQILSRNDGSHVDLIELIVDAFGDAVDVINSRPKGFNRLILRDCKREITEQLFSFKKWNETHSKNTIVNQKIDQILNEKWEPNELFLFKRQFRLKHEEIRKRMKEYRAKRNATKTISRGAASVSTA